MGYPGGFSDKALEVIHLACSIAEEAGRPFATVADLELALRVVSEEMK